MSVYGYEVARSDVRLIRGDSSRLGARWRRRGLDGSVTPVDLIGWSGVVELRSPTGELWWSATTDVMTTDGYAVATVPPNAWTSPEWAGRRSGSWSVTVTSPDKQTVRTLGWGYWHMSD